MELETLRDASQQVKALQDARQILREAGTLTDATARAIGDVLESIDNRIVEAVSARLSLDPDRRIVIVKDEANPWHGFVVESKDGHLYWHPVVIERESMIPIVASEPVSA